MESKIFGLRTTANREDQVMDFVGSNAAKKKIPVYSVIRAHGMRGYIFLEAASKADAEQAAFNVPYARGILSKEIDYNEIEHMLEQVKVEMDIRKNDIVEIISGPFKREQAKISRIDRTKEEVVVELLEAAVPIPITVKMDAVKVIRRDSEEDEVEEEIKIPRAETKAPAAPQHEEKEEQEFVMPKQHESVVKRIKDKVEEVVEDVEEALHIKEKEESTEDPNEEEQTKEESSEKKDTEKDPKEEEPSETPAEEKSEEPTNEEKTQDQEDAQAENADKESEASSDSKKE